MSLRRVQAPEPSAPFGRNSEAKRGESQGALKPAAASGGSRQAERGESQGVNEVHDYARSPANEVHDYASSPDRQP